MIVNNNNSDLPATERQTDNTNGFWGLKLKNVFFGSAAKRSTEGVSRWLITRMDRKCDVIQQYKRRGRQKRRV